MININKVLIAATAIFKFKFASLDYGTIDLGSVGQWRIKMTPAVIIKKWSKTEKKMHVQQMYHANISEDIVWFQ